MIHKLAVLISNKLKEYMIIDSKDYNVVRYGMELLLSSLAGMLIVFSISVLYHKWYLALLYTICFVPLRMTTGGYHAKSYLWCNITVAWTYALVLESLLLLTNTLSGRGWSLMAALFIYGILLMWTPVENANKPVYGNNKARLKRKGILISTLWICFAEIIYNRFYEISCFIFLCLFTVALSVVAAKVENKL